MYVCVYWGYEGDEHFGSCGDGVPLEVQKELRNYRQLTTKLSTICLGAV